jgi:primase-polymerase (primpol)-like protein
MMRVPPELLDYKQWVLWRRAEVNGRVTKIPISPWSGKGAACDKPQTWSSYRHVLYALRRYRGDGIGFVFTGEDPFCGIDLDGCRAVNGLIVPEALELIEQLRSYTELSPSGTGVHILIQAKLPAKGRRSGKIEIYDSRRYFTVTGRHISGTPFAIERRQETLTRLHAELFPSAGSEGKAALTTPVKISDEELIERAKNARNGDRFIRLWAGDASDYANDHSRADLALCRTLAFWCGNDRERIDRLFRRSGLMRGKWDRRTGNSGYGSLTIAAAVSRPHRS